jgi:methyl-accepting chemotaxis protein
VRKSASAKQKLAAKILNISRTKDRISLLRDVLRSETADLEDIIESLGASIEEIEDGLGQIESGIDTASKYL